MSKEANRHIKLEADPDFNTNQKVGQLFMIAVFINDSEENIQKMEQLISKQNIGALCFFHSRASAATNFEGKKKVVYNENSYERLVTLINRYQQAASTPLLIAIDAEWGLAMRIENTAQYPYALTLGALQNREDLISEVGYEIGLDCLEAGIHWNLAPVLDINSNPENPVIGYRSFGDDKEEVTIKAKAFLKGMQKAGVLNSLKHFPGHGDTNTDSHLALPVIDKSAEAFFETELYPFMENIKEADSLMIGHLSVPALEPSGKPATLSRTILTDLVRKKMGYDGVIISDAMNMHAVSKEFKEKGALEFAAFQAGMDMFCFSEHPEEAIRKIVAQSDNLRIDSSFERIWELKKRAFNTQRETINSDSIPEDLNREIAKACITELFKKNQALEKLVYQEVVHITFGNPKSNRFQELLEREYRIKTTPSEDVFDDKMDTQKTIVISIFPPKVKPKDNFGFTGAELDTLNQILKNGNCIVYLFGNPLFIHNLHLSKRNSYVFMYQDFSVFQEVAFSHFKGELKAKGKLPFQLKSEIHGE